MPTSSQALNLLRKFSGLVPEGLHFLDDTTPNKVTVSTCRSEVEKWGHEKAEWAGESGVAEGKEGLKESRKDEAEAASEEEEREERETLKQEGESEDGREEKCTGQEKEEAHRAEDHPWHLEKDDVEIGFESCCFNSPATSPSCNRRKVLPPIAVPHTKPSQRSLQHAQTPQEALEMSLRNSVSTPIQAGEQSLGMGACNHVSNDGQTAPMLREELSYWGVQTFDSLRGRYRWTLVPTPSRERAHNGTWGAPAGLGRRDTCWVNTYKTNREMALRTAQGPQSLGSLRKCCSQSRHRRRNGMNKKTQLSNVQGLLSLQDLIPGWGAEMDQATILESHDRDTSSKTPLPAIGALALAGDGQRDRQHHLVFTAEEVRNLRGHLPFDIRERVDQNSCDVIEVDQDTLLDVINPDSTLFRHVLRSESPKGYRRHRRRVINPGRIVLSPQILMLSSEETPGSALDHQQKLQEKQAQRFMFSLDQPSVKNTWLSLTSKPPVSRSHRKVKEYVEKTEMQQEGHKDRPRESPTHAHGEWLATDGGTRYEEHHRWCERDILRIPSATACSSTDTNIHCKDDVDYGEYVDSEDGEDDCRCRKQWPINLSMPPIIPPSTEALKQGLREQKKSVDNTMRSPKHACSSAQVKPAPCEKQRAGISPIRKHRPKEQSALKLTKCRLLCLRKELPPAEPNKFCFSSGLNSCSHAEVKDALETHTGVKVTQLQYVPLYLRYHEPDTPRRSRWIVELSPDSDPGSLMLEGFRLRGNRVELRRVDDVHREEVRAYHMYSSVLQEHRSKRIHKRAKNRKFSVVA